MVLPHVSYLPGDPWTSGRVSPYYVSDPGWDGRSTSFLQPSVSPQRRALGREVTTAVVGSSSFSIPNSCPIPDGQRALPLLLRSRIQAHGSKVHILTCLHSSVIGGGCQGLSN